MFAYAHYRRKITYSSSENDGKKDFMKIDDFLINVKPVKVVWCRCKMRTNNNHMDARKSSPYELI